LGSSLVSERPVAPDIVKAVPRTLELVVFSLIIALVIGIPLGIYASTHRGQLHDLSVMGFSLVGISVPSFVSGTILLLTFGLLLRWFPTAGYVAPFEDIMRHLRYLFLPAFTLGIALSAIVVRFTRSAMLDVLGSDYVRTARAKGLSGFTILYHHALKNALIPVVTVIGVEAGALLGGAIVVEYVFNWPGMSSLLIQGVSSRDYTQVQGVVLVIAIFVLVINLAVDVINGYLNPEIRYS
jgi:peptide/nickel transport system permease protein